MLIEALDDVLVKALITYPEYRDEECDAYAEIEVAKNTPESLHRFVQEHCDTISRVMLADASMLLKLSPSHVRELIMKGMESLSVKERQEVVKEMAAFSPGTSTAEQNQTPELSH